MDLSVLKRPEASESQKQQQQQEEQTRPKFSYTIASLLESVKRSSSPETKVEKTEQGEEEEDEEEEEEEERVLSEEESDLSVGEEEEEEGASNHPRLAPSHPTPMHPLQVQKFDPMPKISSEKNL